MQYTQQFAPHSGNAIADSKHSRGWFVGSFLPESLGVRHSDILEIKWGHHHRAGEIRPEWATNETRHIVAILIAGKLDMEFRDQTVRLEKPGDYVAWGPGFDHRWRSLADNTVIITVRWNCSDG